MNLIQNLRTSLTANAPSSFLPYIRQHFRALLSDPGDWNPSVYDLAWVLCCDFFPDHEKQRLLADLLAQQHSDGTWGDATYMPHSALIDTLAVAMMCVRNHRPIPHLERMKRSLDWLITKCSRYPHHNTVAFEILAPYLLDWLESKNVGLDLGSQAQLFVHEIRQKAEAKLQILRQSPGLFDPGVSLSYSAEIAALIPLQERDLAQLSRMTLPNGAVGLSPAATAAVIMILGEHNKPVEPALYRYLANTFEDYNQTSFPNLHPIETSRRLWNVLPWLVSGNIFAILEDKPIQALLTRMYREINFDDWGRVSWDVNNVALPDLDDTAVAFALYTVLIRMGVKGLKPASSSSFKHFQRDDGSFFCYPHELHPSPATLLHTLMAVHLATETFGEAAGVVSDTHFIVQNLLRQLDPAGRCFEQLGHDKWHATWTYGIQRWLSLPTIHQAYPDTVKAVVGEILEREQNGGWGQQQPTLEETAYVISGLGRLLRSRVALSDDTRQQVERALQRSYPFLVDAIDDGCPMPPIWISKNLYTPRYQIVSAVLDALYSLSVSPVRISMAEQVAVRDYAVPY